VDLQSPVIGSGSFVIGGLQIPRFIGRTFSFTADFKSAGTGTFRLSHDRFLCIDDDVYHIGASIKDLGKKWFGFSKMEILTPGELVERINRE
jgi:hypothetical protein